MTPKVCAVPGCMADAVSAHTGRCEAHAPPPRWSSSTRPKLDPRKWRLARKRTLHRDKGTCRFCIMPAPTVDHRLPLAWGGLPYDLLNLQAMCEPCHATKTNEERSLGNKLSRGLAGAPEIAAHVARWTP
jgi:hypothetical protein